MNRWPVPKPATYPARAYQSENAMGSVRSVRFADISPWIRYPRPTFTSTTYTGSAAASSP